MSAYSLFVCLWFALLATSWRRREAVLSLEAGMSEYGQKERKCLLLLLLLLLLHWANHLSDPSLPLTALRPEFEEDYEINLAGTPTLLFRTRSWVYRVSISVLIVLLLCAGVISTTAAIYLFKDYLSALNATGAEYASVAASGLTAFQVLICDLVYERISDSLTDYENHRYVVQTC